MSSPSIVALIVCPGVKVADGTLMSACARLMLQQLYYHRRGRFSDAADEVHDVIAMAALPLPPALRSAFTLQVLTRLRACPAESVGVGLVHRIAAEEQRHFLKGGPVAVGGKYGKSARWVNLPFVKVMLRLVDAAEVRASRTPSWLASRMFTVPSARQSAIRCL